GSVGATSSLSHAAAANVASNNTASARSLGFRGFIFLLRIRYEVQGSRNLGGAPPPGQAGRPGSARVSGAHPPDQQLRTGQPAAARAPGRRGRRRPRASPRLGTEALAPRRGAVRGRHSRRRAPASRSGPTRPASGPGAARSWGELAPTAVCADARERYIAALPSRETT